jgi:translation elongation factor EF-Ts
MLSGDNSERLFISGVGALLEQRHDAVTNCKEALQYKDGKLAGALTILEEKGCNSFVDVSRALL